MPRLTLGTRTFLLSFGPILLLLIGTFIAIDNAVHQRVRQDLREALYNSDQLLNRANADFSRENSALLAKLTDSAGLKASVGLLAEATSGAPEEKQVRATIEAQLWELQNKSSYDYLAVTDLRGRTIAAVPATSRAAGDAQGTTPQSGLAESGGELFQVEAVPIEIGGETAAILTLGRAFDLKRMAAGGEAVLLRNNTRKTGAVPSIPPFTLLKDNAIVRSTFSGAMAGSLERQLRENCTKPDGGCEVQVGNETYVASALQREQLGDRYQLIVFRSLDAPLNSFNRAFIPKLIEIGCVGIVIALVCTVITTHSVVGPLHVLASQLETGADTGTLPEKLDAEQGVREVYLVANAFNRVAAAERRTRGELVLAKQAAETANRLKTEFLNNMSHELRTPINGVLGMTELLNSTGLSEEQAEYSDIISNSARTLVSLIDEILDFSELETGRLRLQPRETDPAGILDDIEAVVRARALTKPIAINVVRSETLPARCIGEDKRIRQVLMHLCENAVKFTEQGFIRIAGQYSPSTGNQGRLLFSVEDSGIGIAEKDIGFVFRPFTQVDGSLTRQNGGTGIGLSIAKALVELMGGQYGVESKPGQGSTFWFSVPVGEVESVNPGMERCQKVLETA